MSDRINHGWEHKPKMWEYQDSKIKIQLDSHQIVNNSDNMYVDIDNDLKAIVVLAGGLTDNGVVHEWVFRRLDLAYNIYMSHPDRDNIYIICLGGGTYHKPPILNNDRYVVHESTACADYLMHKGINPKKILKEWSSYDTVANGFFLFTNYILPLHLDNVLVITSEFHTARTKAIFDWINSFSDMKNNVKLSFVSASDNGLEIELVGRLDREQNSLDKLKKNIFPKIKTLNQFVVWFYTEHKAYSCNDQNKRESDVDIEIMKTY